jgi:hypothetical protein
MTEYFENCGEELYPDETYIETRIAYRNYLTFLPFGNITWV